ncbi:CPK28, partial [Symbiodinium pilosum]
MPDVAEAICIDSEEEQLVPQPKRKKRKKQNVPQAAKEPVLLPSCIDLDAEEEKGQQAASTEQPALEGASGTTKAVATPARLSVEAVCLSSDEEGPIPSKSSEAARSGVADSELEQRAQDLADAALQNLPPAARAARLVKVKHSILARLRSQAETGSLPSLPAVPSVQVQAEEVVPPPPPPGEAPPDAQQIPSAGLALGLTQQPQQP